MTSMTFCDKHQYWHPLGFDCAYCAEEKEAADTATLRADLAAARALIKAIVDYRQHCFIPTDGSHGTDGLLNWDERAIAALRKVE
jgi:hypothetical protein